MSNRGGPSIASALLVIAVIIGLVSCEVSIWNECRSDHSWFYCVRVLGDKK